jgi:hypothetical protein
MKPALALTFGYPDGSLQALTRHEIAKDRVVLRDIYSLGELMLHDFHALLISMHCDQRFLAGHSGLIERFLQQGGTVVANGHLAYPFLAGIRGFHPIQDYRIDDLAIVRLVDHPIWHGVSEQELTFRRGVAGFYGRVWHEPPAGATVVHALGRRDRPVDFIYSVGGGRVLFHGGNDLWQFGSNDSTSRVLPQFFQWLFSEAD